MPYMSTIMKAAFLQELGRLEIRDTARPEPGPGEVLVRVRACGICGSDLRSFRHGHHALRLPAILGHEISGEVAALGAGVTGLLVGQHVALTPAVSCGHCDACLNGHPNRCPDLLSIGENLPGGLAEYVLAPARSLEGGFLLPVPAEVSDDAASLVEPLSCILNGQELAGIGLGDNVVVIGLGPVGCMHIAVARQRGAQRIIASDVSAERLRRAHPFGADAYLDGSQQDIVAAVREMTAGQGADVVIVACPSGQAQVQAVQMAALGGRISLFGGLPKDKPVIPLDANLVHYRELRITGAFGMTSRHVRMALQLAAKGFIDTRHLVTHHFPLDEAAQAFEAAADSASLRVIVNPAL
jgi:L-iditol 2-dehydrogenase